MSISFIAVHPSLIVNKAPGICVTRTNVGCMKIEGYLITLNEDVQKFRGKRKICKLPAQNVDWQINSRNQLWLALVAMHHLSMFEMCVAVSMIICVHLALDDVDDDVDDL